LTVFLRLNRGKHSSGQDSLWRGQNWINQGQAYKQQQVNSISVPPSHPHNRKWTKKLFTSGDSPQNKDTAGEYYTSRQERKEKRKKKEKKTFKKVEELYASCSFRNG
jgi:ABC-type glutathione transport system ATPase component